jgi:DedD protein
MALFPFGKRRDAAAAPATPAEVVQRARTRARRRLIGAVVLLGIGVVGFPLLFETQPRPIAVDVDFDIPQRETAPPLAMPGPAGDSARVTGQVATPAAAQSEAPPPAAAPAAASPSAATAAAPAPPAAQRAPPAPATPPTRPPPAVAAAPAAADTPAAQRFVVQVGAFADREAMQQMRARVERLGLVTYTQVVETEAGPRTRVRVGPFASRDEADRAAARLRAAGLTAVVLRL